MTELPTGMTPQWHKTSLTIGHSRACMAKHPQTAVWRWQIPRCPFHKFATSNVAARLYGLGG